MEFLPSKVLCHPRWHDGWTSTIVHPTLAAPASAWLWVAWYRWQWSNLSYSCYYPNSKWVIASCSDNHRSLTHNQGSAASPVPAPTFERHANRCQPPRRRESRPLRNPKVLAANGPYGSQGWWTGSSVTAGTRKIICGQRLEPVSLLPDCALQLLEMPWTSWGQCAYVFSNF